MNHEKMSCWERKKNKFEPNFKRVSFAKSVFLRIFSLFSVFSRLKTQDIIILKETKKLQFLFAVYSSHAGLFDEMRKNKRQKTKNKFRKMTLEPFEKSRFESGNHRSLGWFDNIDGKFFFFL
jgi:hypothetical protein